MGSFWVNLLQLKGAILGATLAAFLAIVFLSHYLEKNYVPTSFNRLMNRIGRKPEETLTGVENICTYLIKLQSTGSLPNDDQKAIRKHLKIYRVVRLIKSVVLAVSWPFLN